MEDRDGDEDDIPLTRESHASIIARDGKQVSASRTNVSSRQGSLSGLVSFALLAGGWSFGLGFALALGLLPIILTIIVVVVISSGGDIHGVPPITIPIIIILPSSLNNRKLSNDQLLRATLGTTQVRPPQQGLIPSSRVLSQSLLLPARASISKLHSSTVESRKFGKESPRTVSFLEVIDSRGGEGSLRVLGLVGSDLAETLHFDGAHARVGAAYEERGEVFEEGVHGGEPEGGFGGAAVHDGEESPPVWEGGMLAGGIDLKGSW